MTAPTPAPSAGDRHPPLLLELLPRDDDGDRFYQPAHGKWRFTFVEGPASDELADEFVPHIIAGHEDGLDEDEFAGFVRDAALFQAAIDPVGCVRAAAAAGPGQ